MSIPRQSAIGVGLAVLLALAATAEVLSSFQDNPLPLKGFTHSPLYAPVESPNSGPGRGKELWVDANGAQRTRPVGFSSPTVADVDRDPSNGKEIVVAGADGIVYLYGADGAQRWQTNVMQGTQNYPCTVPAADSVMHSTPSAGDLEGSGGVLSIVIGYGTTNQSNCEGGIVVLDGGTGKPRWRYSLTGTTTGGTAYPDGPEGLHGVVTTPALADTDGDGKLEIGFGAADRKIYLLNSDGSRRWYYNAADTVKSSATFADVDGDGRLELIIGTDISALHQLPSYDIDDGGFLYAFATADLGGKYLPFPLLTDRTKPYIWRTFFDQVITSSPALGDVLASNAGSEIVVGSGCYFPINNADKRGKYLKVLRPSDGVVLQTLPMPGCTQAAVAIGDLDGNGKLDVVGIASEVAGAGGSRHSSVVAWEPDASLSAPKWTTNALNSPNVVAGTGNDPNGGLFNSPILADLDGNGSIEVLVSNSWAVHVLRGDNGQPLTCQNPNCGGQLSFFAWWSVLGAPAVVDINGDAIPEVVAGGSNAFMTGASGGAPPHGTLYVWTGPYSLGSPKGTAHPYAAPWPQYLGGPQHSSQGQPGLTTYSPTVFRLHAQGSDSPAQSVIVLRSSGGQSSNWSAGASDSRVSVSPSSGTLSGRTVIDVTIDSSGLPQKTGAVSLGSITIGSSDTSVPPITIPVTVQVVSKVYEATVPAVIQ